ncbi:MAG TPA: SigB/SigF/SigG family RNA polymerase sigma factor [Acidimicrobiia bacterium]|nr:SigB/SigF/SigG family RNA polymerase sigma factor [Acidimicrobiia bacterium]
MAFEATERDELRRRLEEYAQTRDRVLRDEIVSAQVGLAEYLARRFKNRGEPIEDLVQVALLGLLKAVERFDPTRGLEFSTFATPTIVGELKRHFRDKGWAVRVPRRVQELHLRMNSVVNALSQELGRSPTIPEIAHRADVTVDEVLEAMEAGRAYRFSSIDTGTNDEEERGPGPAAGQLGTDEPGMEEVEHRMLLSPLIASLPKREQMIIHLRFFRGMTQSEIATRLGISQMHVSRLLARSLAQLRDRAETPSEG